MNEKINSLHRYYIWANKMRTDFYNLLSSKPASHSGDFKGWEIESNMYMSLWYGLLYVVIEGWQELKLSDRTIDELLNNKNTELLKKFRNGTFHFQEKYNDDRFQKFYEEPSTVEWVRNLNREFGRWFLNTLTANK